MTLDCLLQYPEETRDDLIGIGDALSYNCAKEKTLSYTPFRIYSSMIFQFFRIESKKLSTRW